MNSVHIIMYNTSRSYVNDLIMIIFIFIKHLCIMFKILMLSKITIILTTLVNNTDNAHVNDLVYYLLLLVTW